MRDLVIFGCGGFGREILQIVLDQNAERPAWRMRGFLVSPEYPAPSTVQGFPVETGIGAFGEATTLAVAVGIGNPAARRKVVVELVAAGVRTFPPLVHPRAWLGRNVRLADGVIICAGALLTTDIELGEHCHVNIGATVGHDAVLGRFSTLSPGVHLSGRVTLGEGVEIGTGACINPGITIGAGAIIGAAAAVVRDIPADCTAVGVPARVIKGPGLPVGS
ncbi:NeuD/PglB/VioB family sugar acetyltransferase [Tabrizicola flagellatus]|uniref:NeuD/PglB/VioB family sugar acetyltransferase n=1 Tax=Tabrizicola flagellatus TaxID=2593021 RepID=UPI0011F101BC|nr:NeuD/PglB/VioB family sugar acetyltransferase [Tabrizicola flagellatus]